MDFRRFELRAAGVLRLAPQAETAAGGGAPGAPGTLLGGGARDFSDEQRVDATPRLKRGDAGQAGIDHGAHALNGDRGFGHVGGNDDFRAWAGRDGRFLRGGRQRAVKRIDVPAARGGAIFQQFNGPADLVGAGQKHQDVAGIGQGHGLAANLGHAFPDGHFARRAAAPVMSGGALGTVENFHRIDAATGLQHVYRSEKPGQSRSFQGGRHHHHPQAGAQPVLQIEATGQRDVHRQTPLMKLVENHRSHAVEHGIVLKPALEHPIG